jgi:hypothetical protein
MSNNSDIDARLDAGQEVCRQNVLLASALVVSPCGSAHAQTYQTYPTYGGGFMTQGSNGYITRTSPSYGGGFIFEAKKPWLKLEMSRRTWYRRQAEKRAATLRPAP